MRTHLQSRQKTSDGELFDLFREFCPDDETCRNMVEESQNFARQVALMEMEEERQERDENLIYIFNAA